MSSWARLLRPASALAVALAFGTALPAQATPKHRKLDRTLTDRAAAGVGASRVIVTFKPGTDASADAKRLGARLGRRLRFTHSQVMELSNAQLRKLADNPTVESIRWDRPVFGLPTSQSPRDAVNDAVERSPAFTGEGVGVAIIDSGITPWNDELTYQGGSPRVLTKGGQRVAAFKDYVNGRTVPYDDFGHGTHVAGVIAGNGLGSNGLRRGAAPEAHLVVLKVLDATGKGNVSNVIEALGEVLALRQELNIRVVNLSIAAAVLQSIDDDPLAAATKAAVDAGVVVVAAAGNLGRGRGGAAQYGGITAPGNAPWVLTVGAYSQEGTANTRDDIVAPFSSRGPTAIDFRAKPDVLAPGTAIVSLADPTSALYSRRAASLGSYGGHYLSLTGTSVAAPAVAGTVALMAQVNPALTPNLAKAIVQYTARPDDDYDALTQGAGYLNATAAVELARYFGTARTGDPYPRGRTWGRRIIWGNYLIAGGVLWPNASAWQLGTLWGDLLAEDGDNIVWGTLCAGEDCDNIVWGTFEDADNIVWGTDEDGDNIVWGTDCGGEDCDNIVWGTAVDFEDGDNIVWGTAEDVDNIVWGTSCDAVSCEWNIVWGTVLNDQYNIVWGTDCAAEDCDNIVWGTALVPGAPPPARGQQPAASTTERRVDHRARR